MLKMGDRGSKVGALQQQLLEAGESVDSVELQTQTFGTSTRAAIFNFQFHHVDEFGHALAQDGMLGPKTEYALAHPSGPNLIDQNFYTPGWHYDNSLLRGDVRDFCDNAAADIGLYEDPDGSNDGPLLTKFETNGRPWCALAVSHWASSTPIGSPFGIKAGVFQIYLWAKNNRKIVTADKSVEPGDLAGFLRATGHGHIGVVVGVEGDKLYCVEGNNGNAVRGCIRDRNKLQFVARPYGR